MNTQFSQRTGSTLQIKHLDKQNAVIKVWHILYISFFLLITSCVSRPPHETGTFKTTDLVELVKLDSSIHLDIRYATSNNLEGRPVYTEARAFLQKPAAEALVLVNKDLKQLGYGLLIFDGYRPWSVTKLFWDLTPKKDKIFVANPKEGSKHNRGCAADLSLYEIATGKEVQMTGVYDEMSERSYPNYTGGTAEQRKMRDLLRSKMEAHGFSVYEYEWWHFDFSDWKSYRIGNIQFSDIK
jgi:D-alanyl-D-alanine dipeptidase